MAVVEKQKKELVTFSQHEPRLSEALLQCARGWKGNTKHLVECSVLKY